jgi:hypothetical protein
MNFVRLAAFFFIIAAAASAGWWIWLRTTNLSTLNGDQTSNADKQSGGATLPPDDGRFRWGVQVRPFALNRYSDELMEQQLDSARELGVGWIRLDWHNHQDFSWHDRIVTEAGKRGLRVVLILEEIGVPTSDPAVTAKAKEAAGRIAAHFKGRVRYYQLLNEVSGAALRGGEFPGTDFSRDYNQTRYREIRDWVTGAGEGITAVDPEARLIVSGQWTHTAMFDQLIRDGVRFDILGWNWFSDMGDDLNEPVISESVHQKITLLDKLKGFGKELWMTELNHRPGQAGQDEPQQADYIRKVTERIYDYQAFRALFVFELMDQSEVASKDGKPEYYGLVKFSKDSQGDWIIGSRKQAFDAYKQVIAKLSQQP